MDDWDDDLENMCYFEYQGGTICGQTTTGDNCDQCGVPLCPMHAEISAMFCDKHPDVDYVTEEEIDAEEIEELKQASKFDLDEIPF